MIPSGSGALDALVAAAGPAFGLDPGLEAGGAMRLFGLGLSRWAPVVAFSPALGGKLVPRAPKMGLAILFAFVTLPHLGAEAGSAVPSGLAYWLLVLEEAFVGLVLGFGSSLVFWAADVAGRFLDNVRGTTTANLLNPHERVQSSLLGSFYFQLFVVLYFAAGGHLWLLDAIFHSYVLLPALEPGLGAGMAGSFVAGTAGLLAVAMRLVAPALLVLVMMDVMLGVANRMAPQLNVFFLSMSLKSSVGALVAALALYVVLAGSGDLFRSHHRWLAAAVDGLAPDATDPVSAAPSTLPSTVP